MKFLAKALGVVAALMLVYSAWIWWDVRRVRLICHDLAPGVAISQIPVVAGKYGINVPWQSDHDHGFYDKSAKNWYLPVWSVATFGDFTCGIRHNNVVVVSASMEGE